MSDSLWTALRSLEASGIEAAAYLGDAADDEPLGAHLRRRLVPRRALRLRRMLVLHAHPEVESEASPPKLPAEERVGEAMMDGE